MKNEGEMEGQNEETETLSIQWLTSQMASSARAGPGRNQELHPGLPHGYREPSPWAPGLFGRELDLKWNSQNSNLYSYGMLLLQVTA